MSSYRLNVIIIKDREIVRSFSLSFFMLKNCSGINTIIYRKAFIYAKYLGGFGMIFANMSTIKRTDRGEMVKIVTIEKWLK